MLMQHFKSIQLSFYFLLFILRGSLGIVSKVIAATCTPVTSGANVILSSNCSDQITCFGEAIS